MFLCKLLSDDFAMVLTSKWYLILLFLYHYFFPQQALNINCTKAVTLLKKKDYIYISLTYITLCSISNPVFHL